MKVVCTQKVSWLLPGDQIEVDRLVLDHRGEALSLPSRYFRVVNDAEVAPPAVDIESLRPVFRAARELIAAARVANDLSHPGLQRDRAEVENSDPLAMYASRLERLMESVNLALLERKTA